MSLKTQEALQMSTITSTVNIYGILKLIFRSLHRKLEHAGMLVLQVYAKIKTFQIVMHCVVHLIGRECALRHHTNNRTRTL